MIEEETLLLQCLFNFSIQQEEVVAGETGVCAVGCLKSIGLVRNVE
jgi:hypothetical protein